MGFHRQLMTPILGVSTLAPLNRMEGYAEQQINMRSDEKEKLTRRPSADLKRNLTADGVVAGDTAWHEYYRNGQHYLLGLDIDGQVRCWVDAEYIGYTALPTGPFNDLSVFNFNTIYDDTYIINTSKVVTTSSNQQTDLWLSRAHINIASAMNYAEKMELTVYREDIQIGTVVYEVPGLTATNQAEADEKRATNYVAAAVSEQLNLISGITAYSKGSNVGALVESGDLRIEVSTGRGDTAIVVINPTVVSPSGVPKYALEGTVIRVRPNPTTQDGTFYLKAVAQNSTTPETGALVECVWAESQTTEDILVIDKNTVPYVVTILDGVITSKMFEVQDRKVGDNNSNFGPEWLDSTITSAALFQDRLVFLAGNKVSLSKTNDFGQFFLNSVTELLVTDALEIGSSGNSSKLRHAVYHNKDLLIFADNAQFKLAGSIAMSATTGAMPQTTTNEVDNAVPPVQMGNSVMFGTSYGASVGIREYRAEQNTTADESFSLTEHVIGMMPGRITELSANTNQMMLVVRSSECRSNEFFVFESQRIGDSIMPSWSTWEIPSNYEILKISVGLQRINIVTKDDLDVIHLHHIDLHARNDLRRKIHLDDKINLTSHDGLTVELPTGYRVHEDTIVVLGEGSTFPLQYILFTQSGNTLTFDFNMGAGCEVFVGRPFRSSYIPTRPFMRNRAGVARDTDRVYIGHYVLTLVDSYEVTRRIIAQWYDIPDNEFNWRIAGEVVTNIDDVLPYTGEHRFDVGMDAAQCNVEFFTHGYLPLNIAGISYRGQVTPTTERG
jgi:hypothetical protein